MASFKGLVNRLDKWRTRAVRRQAREAQATVATIAQSRLSAADKFSEIYRQKLWVKAGLESGESESLSGHGSSLQSTQAIRDELQRLLDERHPKVFFDAPCGDFNWIRTLRFPEDCIYIGGDIVASVIAGNRQSYARGTADLPGSRVFEVFDLTKDEFPDADFWFCKDCLQHLSFHDVRSTLANFASSNVAVALISNHHGIDANVDIETGDFRYLDLTLPPFNLSEPQRTLKDYPVDGEPRLIAMWTREEIARALSGDGQTL